MVTVLVLHRSHIQRVALGSVLREALQWNVVFATELPEAEEYLRHVPVDLILAQPQTVAGDRHVFDVLRTNWPDVPVVAIVQRTDHRAALDALVAGAIAAIAEDAAPGEITRTLEQVLASFKQYARVPGLLECMTRSETEFVVRNDRRLLKALVERLVAGLRLFGLCPSGELTRVALALEEALVNAADHGCMELDSRLRESAPEKYFELATLRERNPAFRNRKIRVREVLSRKEARFVIRDEGSGFDVAGTLQRLAADGEQRSYGRGLMLIKAIMDEVHFNEVGNEVTLVFRAKSAPQDEMLMECWDEYIEDDDAGPAWDVPESPSRLTGLDPELLDVSGTAEQDTPHSDRKALTTTPEPPAGPIQDLGNRPRKHLEVASGGRDRHDSGDGRCKDDAQLRAADLDAFLHRSLRDLEDSLSDVEVDREAYGRRPASAVAERTSAASPATAERNTLAANEQDTVIQPAPPSSVQESDTGFSAEGFWQ